MKKQLLRSAIVGALAAMSMGGSTALAADGTASLDLTVDANITTGTCAASVIENNNETNTIAFGSVYVSEVYRQTRSKAFAIRFSDCAGLQGKKALLKVAPNNVACPGTSGTDGQYANASTATTKAKRAAVEVWTTDTPKGPGAVKLHCWSKPVQTIDLSGASTTTPVDYPMSALMVGESGATPNDMTAGDFYSPTIFTITYQ
ncbi:fimbrial protein [Salmonella enterica]|nr:fimbrial protein [Salmonella enterica]EHI7783508.1 fimbrial protein [Salmonella enterica]KKA51041.1 fimbrial protein [Salmonella enterica subsp. salamae serovar 42:f,g,t:--]